MARTFWVRLGYRHEVGSVSWSKLTRNLLAPPPLAIPSTPSVTTRRGDLDDLPHELWQRRRLIRQVVAAWP